jgi:hypothetical protein
MSLARVARSTRPGQGCDKPDGLVKPGVDEGLLDCVGELEIEGIFGNATRAEGARHIDGVADVDDDAEGRTLAGRGFGRARRGRRGLLAARRMPCGAHNKNKEEASRSGMQELAHDRLMIRGSRRTPTLS